jgi:hypothetical protein
MFIRWTVVDDPLTLTSRKAHWRIDGSANFGLLTTCKGGYEVNRH